MKHVISYILIPLMTLFSACGSVDEPDRPGDVEMVSVSMNIHLGETDSRSETPTVSRLVMAVYDTEGNLLPELGTDSNGQIIIDSPQFPVDLSLTLVKGQQYKLSCWAMTSNAPFDTSDLREVKIYPAEISLNDDAADAFYKTETFTAVTDGSRRMVLRRAMATINFITTTEGLEQLRNAMLDGDDMVTFTVAGIPSQFDLIDESVDFTFESAVSFASSAFEPRSIDVDLGIPTPEGGYYLFGNVYLFAPAMATEIRNASLSFGDIEMSLPTMIYQRNFNTNVLFTTF